MAFEKKPNRFLLGFILGMAIFLIVNLVQIGIEYSIRFSGDVSYGFPYSFYEYWHSLSRGRYLVGGLISNLIIAILFSSLLGLAQHLYYNHLRRRPVSILE